MEALKAKEMERVQTLDCPYCGNESLQIDFVVISEDGSALVIEEDQTGIGRFGIFDKISPDESVVCVGISCRCGFRGVRCFCLNSDRMQ